MLILIPLRELVTDNLPISRRIVELQLLTCSSVSYTPIISKSPVFNLTENYLKAWNTYVSTKDTPQFGVESFAQIAVWSFLHERLKEVSLCVHCAVVAGEENQNKTHVFLLFLNLTHHLTALFYVLDWKQDINL